MPSGNLNARHIRDLLQQLDFVELFNQLGWNRPGNPKSVKVPIQDTIYTRREIAELSGVVILEVEMPGGKIPDAKLCRAIHRDISHTHHENMLVFLDSSKDRTQSFWYLMKGVGKREEPRTHLYVKGQPGDLSLGKLESMVFDIGYFEEKGTTSVLDVAKSLQRALDVERVIRKFYEAYKTTHDNFAKLIGGIDDEQDKRQYASLLLNRLMFVYFLQYKRLIDNGKSNYLQDKLAESRDTAPDLYYKRILNTLFFKGFAKLEDERDAETNSLIGSIRYLNGGLFLPHRIELKWPAIRIADDAFEKIFELFSGYTWNLDDTPGGKDDEISPHVLGYIFEKYINQKSFGAYYTRPQITSYLCERTISNLILQRINGIHLPGRPGRRHFETIDELLMNLDANLCRELLDLLPTIAILDPACGSGAFLVSAMNTLTRVYGAITGRINVLNDAYLRNWLRDASTKHKSLFYYIKKKIITENLFGVDIMEEATEIARLRLFLALVASVETVEELEPLPNIDFNILPGNSLIGLLHVNEQRLAQLNLFAKPYHEEVAEKDLLVSQYRAASGYIEDLQALRDQIQAHRDNAVKSLNELLLDDFKRLDVKYIEATWDEGKNGDGRAKKRMIQLQDITALQPFHWGYEFDKVMERGGFDIIIANPPWEALKPQAKEFFSLHSELISKNKMRIEEFDAEREKLLQNAEVRAAWLKYQNSFPYQSAYFRAVEQYANQISMVDGKKAGTDINLYKLFTEQCYNLLREGGQCGIVLPSGIYTDLGAKQLREMLFKQTQITGLFCFENRKAIFENVDSRFKFVVLTFAKGGQTATFPAAFMRQEADELERFPRYGALELSVELIRRLSPDSLSIMEFRTDNDIAIVDTMLQVPTLGARERCIWNFTITNEFHMTNDHTLFKSEPAVNRLPLYEGKMIHQFNHSFSSPRYWVDADEGRNKLQRGELRRVEEKLDRLALLQGDISQIDSRPKRVAAFLATLGLPPLSPSDVYIAPDAPRLAFRNIARSTDARTLIATILPPGVFAGNSLNHIVPWHFNSEAVLEQPASIKECYQPTFPPNILAYLCGVFNSFALDYTLRFKVTTNANMFYIYQMPVVRLDPDEPRCKAIAARVARLVCIGPEFDELRRKLLGSAEAPVATKPVEREQLQAEIDGLVAHLYGLTEADFEHILSTFPIVEPSVKDAALKAHRKFALPPSELELAAEMLPQLHK